MADTITHADIIHSKNAADVLVEKRKRLEKYVDDILKLPRGPQRWRAAVNLAIKLNIGSTPGMTAREEYNGVAQLCADTRKTRANEYADSTDLNTEMRFVLEMPAFANYFIRMIDPQAFDKENLPKLRKEFKEFQIAEKY